MHMPKAASWPGTLRMCVHPAGSCRAVQEVAIMKRVGLLQKLSNAGLKNPTLIKEGIWGGKGEKSGN